MECEPEMRQLCINTNIKWIQIYIYSKWCTIYTVFSQFQFHYRFLSHEKRLFETQMSNRNENTKEKKAAATTATVILALNSLSSQWKCSKLFINMMCGTVYAPCAYFHSQISHENLFIRWEKSTFFVSDILRRHLMKSTSFCCRARFRSSSLKSCTKFGAENEYTYR